MSTTTLNTKFQLRRDSYSNWHTANPKLDDGEPILVEINGVYKLKIGDGNTYFDNLPYYNNEDSNAIQALTSHTINGQSLINNNISLNANDVGALSNNITLNGQTINTSGNTDVSWRGITMQGGLINDLRLSDDNNGSIVDSTGNYLILGISSDSSTLQAGAPNKILNLRGNQTRPTYNTSEQIALISDLPYNKITTFTHTGGYVLKSDGKIYTANSYHRTYPIQVYENDVIKCNLGCYSDTIAIAFSQNKEAEVWTSLANGVGDSLNNYEVTVPADGYVIFSYNLNRGLTLEITRSPYQVIESKINRAENRPIRNSMMKNFGTQPAADGSSGSFCNVLTGNYNTLLNSVYEPLRTAHPDYITRENIGKDASNTYDMYVYTFAPRYYQQSIILIGGVHANEEDSIACLARIMQLITNADGTDVDLMYLRQNVKITVIPVLNVWGFSQNPKVRTNYNGSSLQTWTSSPLISELANLKPILLREKDEASFLLDMHSTTNNTYKDFYGVINPHDKNVRTLFKTVSWLCDQYALEGNIDSQYLGYLDMPGLLSNYWHGEQNMTTATMELSDYHWDNTKSTSTVITMGVTMFLNYIIQQVNDGYKIIKDIPNSDYRESRG